MPTLDEMCQCGHRWGQHYGNERCTCGACDGFVNATAFTTTPSTWTITVDNTTYPMTPMSFEPAAPPVLYWDEAGTTSSPEAFRDGGSAIVCRNVDGLGSGERCAACDRLWSTVPCTRASWDVHHPAGQRDGYEQREYAAAQRAMPLPRLLFWESSGSRNMRTPFARSGDAVLCARAETCRACNRYLSDNHILAQYDVHTPSAERTDTMPAPPGNAYVTSGPYCDQAGSASGDALYMCMAREGHTGDHIGYTSAGRYDDNARWPNEADATPGNEFQPREGLRCQNQHLSWNCFASRGHTGEHIAYSSTGVAPDAPSPSGRRWPNTAQPAPESAAAPVAVNAYQPDRDRQCRAANTYNWTYCNATRGHGSDHICYDTNGTEQSCWPNRSSRPASYAYGYGQCGARGRRIPGRYIYTCNAASGHLGDHVTWHSDGNTYHPDGRWAAAPPDPATAPGNGYEPRDNLRCGVTGSASGPGNYQCYARRGHNGDHIGWSDRTYHAPDAVWPNPDAPDAPPPPPAEPWEPAADRRCGNIGYAPGASSRHTCTVRAGHPGDHVAWAEAGASHPPYGRWRNTEHPDGGLPGNGYERNSSLRCRQVDPGRNWECTARRAHAGDHVGWRSRDAHDAGAMWVNTGPLGLVFWNPATSRAQTDPVRVVVNGRSRVQVCPDARRRGDRQCRACGPYWGSERCHIVELAEYDVHQGSRSQVPPEAQPEPFKLVPRKVPGPALPERLIELLICSGSGGLTSGQARLSTGDPQSECTLRRLVTRGIANVDKSAYPYKYTYNAPEPVLGYTMKLPKGQRRVPRPEPVPA